MHQILSRFDTSIFEVVVFGDECILNQPVERWPLCDCLMAWYSSGFPLDKTEAYVRLRNPFCINDVSREHVLRDRRKFYATLQAAHIPLPHHVVVNRDGSGPPPVVFEMEDAIEVNGVRINKPFVEKVSGDASHSY
jgi:inositol hexakisphosphate/diphosphoinositol-pentakisphosphate kinase